MEPVTGCKLEPDPFATSALLLAKVRLLAKPSMAPGPEVSQKVRLEKDLALDLYLSIYMAVAPGAGMCSFLLA